ncbi:MAG: alkaline shock response membrane anchor protein AmaP, partial [Actinomycetes bacterium]
MNSRANVINRVALTVLGLLLVAAGGLGLAVGVDALGGWQATDPVLRQEVSTFPDEHRWFWWVVSGALLLIAVLALLWLLAQLKTDRTTRLDLT